MQSTGSIITTNKVLTTADIIKFLCAIMVVGIHTQPLGDRLNGGG